MTSIPDLPARPAAPPAGPSREAFPRSLHNLAAALILIALYGLAVGSALNKSPVVGEGEHIARGWAALRVGRLLPADHPPLADLLAGAGALLEPGMPHPVSLPGWAEGDATQLGKGLLWQSGQDASRVVFLARLPGIWVALLLGAITWRWGRATYGRWGALIALAALAFAPGVLAHAALATPDLVAAALYVATLYAWTRFLRRPAPVRLLVSGLALGMALSASFTALPLIPTLALMALWASWRRGLLRLGKPFDGLNRWPLGWLWRALAALLAAGVVGAAGMALVYLIAGRQWFAPVYGAELTGWLAGLARAETPYLLERFSAQGWWYQWVVVLGTKLPLPMLLLIGLAAVLVLAQRPSAHDGEIVLPGVVYLAAVSAIPLAPELRTLLPLLALLCLFVGSLGRGPLELGWLRPALAGTLIAALFAQSLLIYPNYLAFFNLIAGGPDNASRVLSGSNLDRGQDLPGLAAYLEQRNAGPIYLSYFGEADPAYYGINYLALPSPSPLPPGTPVAEFYPLNPAPGLYAISATNLVGASPGLGDTFSYFRNHEPVERVGNSIYIYQVFPETLPSSERNQPWFAVCGDAASAEHPDRLLELTGIPDLAIFSFDCTQSLAFPNGAGWLLLPAEIEPVVDIGPADYVARYQDGAPRYRVWLVQRPPSPPPSRVEFPAVPLPLPIAGHLELLGYEVSSREVATGDTLALTSWWRVREPPAPPVMFAAQLAAPDGEHEQHIDGLGVVAEDWRPGMVIVQQHRFAIGGELPPGSYTLSIGLFSPATGERFTVFRSGDRVLNRIVLRGIEVVERR